ncbi:hypothetical protein N7490_008342 [Penicillium lividum]|nr:hypothetical protein N7490_008342 [Penicillium lividum]
MPPDTEPKRHFRHPRGPTLPLVLDGNPNLMRFCNWQTTADLRLVPILAGSLLPKWVLLGRPSRLRPVGFLPAITGHLHGLRAGELASCASCFSTMFSPLGSPLGE